MTNKRYKFAEEFTKFPGGRFKKNGPFSGEMFRDDVLLPLIKEADVLEIDLTGVKGLPSSFLDESFGEVAKRLGIDSVKARLKLECEDDPLMVDVIWAKMAKAAGAH